jgi:hypothetical protein
VGRLLFQPNYPLDVLEVEKPIIALYSGIESFIVAPAPGRETRAENNSKNIPRGIQDGHRVVIRAAMALFSCDNRTESVHINIQLQKEGAQAW